MIKSHKLSTLAAGLLLLAGLAPARAQETPMAEEPADQETAPAQETAEPSPSTDPSTSSSKGFSFRFDPIVIGAIDTNADTNSSKFQEYRDLSSGFTLGFNLLGENADGERNLAFNTDNAGRRDARYTLSYGVPGRYSVLFDYNKIPHRFGNAGRMLYTRTGPGRLEIADPIQGAIQGAIATQAGINPAGITYPFLRGLLAPYLNAAQFVDLALQRDRTLARVDLGRMGRLGWGLEYTHEARSGNRPFGGSFGFSNATEIPEPIDYDTTGAEISGEFNTANSGLRLGYRYSRFRNNVSTVVWDNPFRLTGSTDPNAYTAPGAGSINGSAVGFADLAASNDANLLFVNGRTRLGSWWASGAASYNRMTQDDPLLPYTLNPSIVGIDLNGARFDPTNPANLPTRSADREVVATSLQASAGTRFGAGERWDLTFRYRLYDYDNNSPRVEIPGYVRFHAVWEPIARITVPYAYSRQNARADLGWNLGRASHLLFGYERESWDRDFREINSSDEDIFRVAFDTRPSDRLTLRARYEYGDRSIGEYDTAAQEFSFVEPEGITNLPGLRKYDQAARTYDSINVEAQVFATEAWSFTFGATSRYDDYDESEFGLRYDDILQYNAEVSYTPGENLSFFLFGHRADRETQQRSRQSGATPSTNPLDDWTGTFDELTDTWGLGLNAKLSPRWSTDLSANWTRSDGEADLFSPPGGTPNVAVGFDNYEDIELLSLLGRVDYRINPSAAAGLFYRWEDYTLDSFILQGLQYYLPGALLLNPSLGDYRGTVLGVDLSLTF
ncbi:MAG TPA: MtrB/PioB family outer membrane beta-barrel protein [Thermoanaerobaculia bacterium]|nr:MtrB/PioB family outer membrane beta-barrel protein [Thermoanaerobaculia bacterium]